MRQHCKFFSDNLALNPKIRWNSIRNLFIIFFFLTKKWSLNQRTEEIVFLFWTSRRRLQKINKQTSLFWSNIFSFYQIKCDNNSINMYEDFRNKEQFYSLPILKWTVLELSTPAYAVYWTTKWYQKRWNVQWIVVRPFPLKLIASWYSENLM